MQQQNIQMVGAQPAQAGLGRFQKILFGKVVAHPRPDAAFALQHHALPQARLDRKQAAEGFLAGALAVNVGVVEKVHAQLQGIVNVALQLGGGERCDAHAAQRHGRNAQAAAAQVKIFHNRPPCETGF